LPIHSYLSSQVKEQKITSAKDATRVISQILDSEIDALTLQQLSTQSGKVCGEEGESAADSLTQIKSVFKKLARSLEAPQTEVEFEESKSVLNKIIDWCVTNWYVLSTSVAEEKAVLDIYKAVQSLSD
jgi:hypothetical protein